MDTATVNDCLNQAVSPLNIGMSVGNAMLCIRAWEVTHQRFMPDLDQVRVILTHIHDFLAGRAFIYEQRKETIRQFIEAVCPDPDAIKCLQELLEERRQAG